MDSERRYNDSFFSFFSFFFFYGQSVSPSGVVIHFDISFGMSLFGISFCSYFSNGPMREWIAD